MTWAAKNSGVNQAELRNPSLVLNLWIEIYAAIGFLAAKSLGLVEAKNDDQGKF